MNVILGHKGMVGRQLGRVISAVTILGDLREEYTLVNGSDVYFLAGKVGGIEENINNPIPFLVDNLELELNVFKACAESGSKLMYLGSSCMYPKECRQPMREDDLGTGKLEPTNEGYALAKLVGVQLGKVYESVGLKWKCLIPCNIYGTGDNYSLSGSHVMSALIYRFMKAKAEDAPSVTILGSGRAEREFIHVSDVVRAMVYFMDLEFDNPVNIGTGESISISELAKVIKNEVGYKGEILYSGSNDGMMKKCLDVTKMRSLGFKTEVNLIDGIRQSIKELNER